MSALCSFFIPVSHKGIAILLGHSLAKDVFQRTGEERLISREAVIGYDRYGGYVIAISREAVIGYDRYGGYEIAIGREAVKGYGGYGG